MVCGNMKVKTRAFTLSVLATFCFSTTDDDDARWWFFSMRLNKRSLWKTRTTPENYCVHLCVKSAAGVNHRGDLVIFPT